MEKDEFLERYKAKEKFAASGLRWEDLCAIAKDHEARYQSLKSAAVSIVDQFQPLDYVHLTDFRIKDPEHLIEKIIRKKSENPSLEITPQNYKIQITDLIGIRIIHIFKKEWDQIHTFITATWVTKEEPKVYFRNGDDIEQYKRLGCITKPHDSGYRSAHYLIKIPSTEIDPLIVEIQVRTIFEEGWGEIDHKLRYPHNMDNKSLGAHLKTLNLFAGGCDELASNIWNDRNDFINQQNAEKLDQLKTSKDLKEGEKVIPELTEEMKDTPLLNESQVKTLINHFNTDMYLRIKTITDEAEYAFSSRIKTITDEVQNISPKHPPIS